MNVKKILALTLILLAGFFRVTQATQLSGSYTIDAAGIASATTFKNVSSAIAYLTGTGSRTDAGPANTAPFGVSGPVVFMIAPGTYTEQVVFKGVVTGSSPVNTITFEGTNAATRILTFAATLTGARHTLKLDSTKYVSFRNLSIRATGATYGWGIHITNTNCNANKITNCMVSITGAGAASTSANYCGIVVGGNVSTATTGIGLDSLELDSNTITSGFYGIITSGLTTYYQKANKIRYNKISGSYSYAIYTVYQDGINISNNTLIPRSGVATTNGILVMNSNSAATATGIVVNKNKISNFGIYGIRISATLNNNLGTKGEVCNNMIGGGITGVTSSPISITGSNFWNISNNSVNHDIAATAAVNAGISITAGFNINVLNNIVAETKGGLGLPVYVSTITAVDTINNNIYYRSDTSNNQLVYVGGTTYNSGNFKRSGIADSNSIFLKPLFVNDTNLRLFNSCYTGKYLPYILTDIDGTTRGIQPVIGAHEAQSVANNIAVLEIINPTSPIDTGIQDLVVKVKNVGSTTITGFTVSYVHNGGSIVSQSWTGSLAACDTISVVFTGSMGISLVAANYLKVYTSLPNGVADGNTIDDSVSLKLYHILNGTYTIGGTGSTFASFSDARDALQLRGIAGPVTFMVNPGTYAEQLVINGPISGSSAVNTITFDGASAATRIITSSLASAATVILNQCNDMHFRNITIRNTYAGSCAGFAWVGSNINTFGRSNSIKHCVINLANLNTASSIGIVATGSANGFASGNNRMDSLVVDSNTITGCNYGISLTGNSVASNSYNRDYKVRGNLITTTDAQSDVAVFISAVYNGVETTYNTITAAGGVGIYYANCGNNFTGNAPHEMSYNKLTTGYEGLQMDASPGSAANATRIYNNSIFIRSSAIAVGIYIYDGGVDKIYHNTIHIDSASALILGMCLNYSGSNASQVKNNIFAYSGSNAGTVYPVHIAGGVTGDNLNYNVYYNASGNDLVSRNGAVYGITNLLTDSTGGDSSYNLKPSFASDTDLHLTTGCPRGVDLTTMVTEDIDAISRSTSPSIGSYEFSGYSNDLQVQQISLPTAPVSVGPQDVEVLLANNGNNAITSLTIGYQLNAAAPVNMVWTGYLAACDTLSVIFGGVNQVNIPNSINTLKVYTFLPNGIADGNPLNDTVTKQVAPALNGNYIIGSAPSDFINFTAAAAALTQRGVSGPVVLNAKTAIYTESFLLPSIAGASAINTITFQSMAGHRDSVKIVNSGAAASTVTLSGTSFTNFRNLTFSQMTVADYNSALFVTGMSSFDSIENCNIAVPPFVSNPTMAFYANALTGTGLVVRNNIISGGYGGIVINLFDAFLGTGAITYDHLIENNTITNANTYSIFIYRVPNLTLRNNTMNADPLSTSHTGIQLESCDSSMQVAGNKVRGISGGYGIYLNACTGAIAAGAHIVNNEVSIGTGTNGAYGIYAIASTRIRFYNNSVNVNSTATVGAGAGYFSGNGDYDIRNNILANMGGGPAITVGSPYRFDYNNLYTSGTVLAKYSATSYANLALWRTSANAPDLHSVSFRPAFTSNTNLQPNGSDTACWALNGRGFHLTTNTVDINNNPRPSVLADGVPDIGAYEFTPLSMPPQAIPTIVTPVAGDTQVFVSVFAPKDTVASIYWDIVNINMPTAITVRQYSGEKPKNIGTASNYMYFYTDMDGTATDLYHYGIDLHYKQIWLGTLPLESDMRITRKTADATWMYDAGPYSVTDTTRNVMITRYLTDSSAVFSGTDMYAPLPVQLISLSAARQDKNAIIGWTTASENNSAFFEVERSYDGLLFAPVGKIKATVKNKMIARYQYTDINPAFEGTFDKPVYYRLKMVDVDGKFTYSKTVNISWQLLVQANTSIFPNPFTEEVFVSVETAAAAEVKLTWMDLTGNIVMDRVNPIPAGATTFAMLTGTNLLPGIYFVSVEVNGIRRVYKVIKK
jgi:hypothetical protein